MRVAQTVAFRVPGDFAESVGVGRRTDTVGSGVREVWFHYGASHEDETVEQGLDLPDGPNQKLTVRAHEERPGSPSHASSFSRASSRSRALPRRSASTSVSAW